MRDHFVTQGPRTGTVTGHGKKRSAMAADPAPAKAGPLSRTVPPGHQKGLRSLSSEGVHSGKEHPFGDGRTGSRTDVAAMPR